MAVLQKVELRIIGLLGFQHDLHLSPLFADEHRGSFNYLVHLFSRRLQKKIFCRGGSLYAAFCHVLSLQRPNKIYCLSSLVDKEYKKNIIFC